MNIFKFTNKNITLVFIVAAIIILVATISFATNRKYERFTELYFNDFSTIPTHINPNQNLSFTFTVHNLEGKDMTYSYEIFVDAKNRHEFYAKGNIQVKKDEYQTIHEVINVKNKLSNAKVSVRLANKDQNISFFINK